MRNLAIMLLGMLSCLCGCSSDPGIKGGNGSVKCDVCVYGETPAGFTAAVQAARMGKDVVLVSSCSHIGGTMTSGLTATDINKHTQIGGIAIELFERIYAYYLNPAVWTCQTRDEFMESTLKRTFTGKNDARKIQWVYEAGVCEKFMNEMLQEAGVKVIWNARLLEDGGVSKSGTVIKSVSLTDGSVVKASQFIDCSYEGDLMAQAGISYIVGRESSEKYGESLAGIRVLRNGDNFGDMPIYDPETGKPWPYVDAELWGKEGDGDNRVQSYCYRLTLTDNPANLVPITKPEKYDPKLYALLLGKILANPGIELKSLITFTPMPNRKTDTNHLDFFNAAHKYPEAGYAERAEIAAAHKNYAQGMLWFLGHDERVPEYLRTEMLRWGYAADEYKDNGNFPYQMYVREARRMIGEHVMVQQNVVKDGRITAPKCVAIGTYALDCHYVSNVIVDGKIYREGPLQMKLPVGTYPISYDSITPKRGECTNLLVPVCLSSSHVAYGSIRMEPQYMVLGQSAATAACLCIDSRCKVQELSYDTLKAKLLKDGQILL